MGKKHALSPRVSKSETFSNKTFQDQLQQKANRLLRKKNAHLAIHVWCADSPKGEGITTSLSLFVRGDEPQAAGDKSYKKAYLFSDFFSLPEDLRQDLAVTTSGLIESLIPGYPLSERLELAPIEYCQNILEALEIPLTIEPQALEPTAHLQLLKSKAIAQSWLALKEHQKAPYLIAIDYWQDLATALDGQEDETDGLWWSTYLYSKYILLLTPEEQRTALKDVAELPWLKPKQTQQIAERLVKSGLQRELEDFSSAQQELKQVKALCGAKIPLLWPWFYQNELGRLYSDWGLLTGSRALFSKSEHHLLNALKIFTQDQHPIRWASRQGELGRLYVDWGRLTQTEKLFRQAEQHLIKALSILTQDQHTVWWADCQRQLGFLYRSWGNHTQSEELFRQAEQHLLSALGTFTKDQHLYEWADCQRQFGFLYSAWAQYYINSYDQNNANYYLKQLNRLIRNSLQTVSTLQNNPNLTALWATLICWFALDLANRLLDLQKQYQIKFNDAIRLSAY